MRIFSYTADSCNNLCWCGDDPLNIICTLFTCGTDPSSFKQTCNECNDGYIASADGLTCELEDEGCFCPLFFDPVCCDGKTYGNTCKAGCAIKSGECSGTITDGVCIKRCNAITCESGEKCIYDPTNGSRCVDENVCCNPQIIENNPGLCFEGCQCCPNGEWSGSIGDGKTYCGGLVSGKDKFGDICGDDNDDDDDELKKCIINAQCSFGYKCRQNPNCIGNNYIKCRPKKVCLDKESGFCSFDNDCSNGYSCIGNENGYGYGRCIKFEQP